MKNLIKAINNVMKDVENIEKNLNVGAGNNSYKGIADKDVKIALNRSMRNNGLVLFTVKIEPNLKIERWEEKTNYGLKQKQSVFTEVLTTYELMHESGESKLIQGYGHGVDSQDKSAGKATTYALKYALLYQFLVATGELDDADKTHSESIPEPIKAAAVKSTESDKKWITNEQFKATKTSGIKGIKAVFNSNKIKMRDEQKEELQEIYNNLMQSNN